MKYVFYTSIVLFAIYLFIDKIELGGISLLLFIISGTYLLCKRVWKVCKKPIKDNPQKSPVTFEVKLSRGSDDGTFYTRIAGVEYRNDAQDIGGFLGYVCFEPTNPYDKNAVAIYRNDGKHVGYIPKDETKDFREWSGKDNLPCVGFIKDGDEVELYGKAKIIDTDKDEMELIVAKFVKWLVSNFGVKFIPVGFKIDTDTMPRTKKDWLAFLTEYIDEKENELYEEM